MHIRPYRSSDCPALAELFYQTVHAVNARDYSPEQLDAWADGRVELAAWDASFRAHDTRVAVEGGVIVGFADLGPDGYLDRLYVHRDWQGRGVASALCDALPAARITHACHKLVEHLLGLKVLNRDKARALAHAEHDNSASGIRECANRFPHVAGKRRGALLDLDVKIVRAHAS